MKNNITVRFAPSPTGSMHLGNVRAALINYIFAKKKGGCFILRIEDTDQKRNISAATDQILDNLKWLNIEFNSGPYFQSKRTDLYQKYFNILKNKNLLYRCFCTIEELEAKRKAQLAKKLPPKYDRTCLNFTQGVINKKIEEKIPFIWRFKLDQDKAVKFYDLAHKSMAFKLKNFSDPAITRQDGSFTFIFTNFVDDHEMKITHVFRGEDHLTNTATQVALYNALDFEVPIFWHLPILVNKEGKKLSKRDFGFALNDLKKSGFLPEAINNYLAIIGSSLGSENSSKKEIMTVTEIINSFNFENISTTGGIKYDLEKLKWINHEWIMNYNTQELTKLCRPFLIKSTQNPEIIDKLNNLNNIELSKIVKYIQPEMVTLDQSFELLKFYFERPDLNKLNKKTLEDLNFSQNIDFLKKLITKIKSISSNNLNITDSNKQDKYIVDLIKSESKKNSKSIKEIFQIIRLALTGKTFGLSILELIEILGLKEFCDRLNRLNNLD